MQESKKHHHVPVFYLRRWSSGDGRIHVIRNINGKIARSRHAPDHVAFENHLYSYHEDYQALDRSEIETTFLAPLDNEGARIVSMMIDDKPLEKRDRKLWTQFLTSMKARVPEIIDKMKAGGEMALIREMESAQADYAKLRRDVDPKTAVDWVRVNRPGLIESIGVGQLPKIASYPKAMQDVLSFEWHIVNFDGSTKPLLTSDRPCVYTEGLDKPNCVIALPLSPRRAFFAFRPNSDAQRNLMKTSTSRLAARLNESVVCQAAIRAFSQNACDAPDEFFLRRLKPSS